MGQLGESLASTPTWALATVTAALVALSLLIEHSLHILTRFVDRRKRKSLHQAVSQIKGELRNLGFITLLLTMARQPVSKICISVSMANTFLPCKDKPPPPEVFAENANSCAQKGKVPLMSSEGIQHLQLLIFMLAVFHVVSSLVTLCLGEIKMKKWGRWEDEAGTLEYQLSNDPRRFKLAKQTSFGRRHLKFWSYHCSLLWIICFVRQFNFSISRADYLALRNGYIDTHLGINSPYNFHKFLRRSLDKDFKGLVSISPAIWTFVIIFIFFNAAVFNHRYWLPFIPLAVLLAIGTKLEVIITKMCLKSNKHKIIVSGEIYVNPNDELFWFRRPRWLLHAIHFIIIQNSFQLAFTIWSWYKYGFKSCFQSNTQDLALNLAGSILVHFLCAYSTLPLYSLVNQMGSTMRETVFADRVVAGLKNWQYTAKKSVSSLREFSSTATSSFSVQPSTASRRGIAVQPSTAGRRGIAVQPSTAGHRGTAAKGFQFPTRRRELEEIQRVTEEMMGGSHPTAGINGGEMSFRMWWKQDLISSPIAPARLVRPS